MAELQQRIGSLRFFQFLAIALHGLFLFLINLTGMVAGFAAGYYVNRSLQFLIQIPVAILFSIGAFLGWHLAVRRRYQGKLALRDEKDYFSVWVAALIWNPVLFIPAHYITQGYLTGAGNIIALAMFQGLTNLLTLLVTAAVTSARDRKTS